nr:RIP metalloprotease RseP [Nitrospiraceae bacterium]
FFFIFISGVPYLLPEVGEVTAGSPAAMAGIVKGDGISGIDGAPITQWDDMTAVIHKSPGKKLDIKISRGGSSFVLAVTPERKKLKDIFGQDKEVGLIGITPSGRTEIRHEGISGSVAIAAARTWDISVLTLLSIIKLIQRVIPADTIGGPIMIFQMAGQQASHGAVSFFTFMAVISINLGVLNVLPIPILDGGHLLFIAVELIRRKPLSEKVMMIAQRVGLALLVTLMVFALYNDILRIVTGKTLP